MGKPRTHWFEHLPVVLSRSHFKIFATKDFFFLFLFIYFFFLCFFMHRETHGNKITGVVLSYMHLNEKYKIRNSYFNNFDNL